MGEDEKSPLLLSQQEEIPANYESIYHTSSSENSLNGVHTVLALIAAKKYPNWILFRRRWWLISVFCLCDATLSIVQNSFSPVSQSMNIAYNWTDSFIALQPGLANFAFVLTAFPVMYLVYTTGLHLALLVGSGLMIFCMSLWIIGLANSFKWMICVGSAFIGIARAILMGSLPLVSLLWFPVRERTTANALTMPASYLGTGIVFLSGPFISAANITGPEIVSKNISSDYILNRQNGLMDMLYFDAGLCLMCFLGVVFYFPDKPPKVKEPNIERVDFKKELKSLMKNGPFWLLNIAYNLPNATYNAWLSVISISFESLGVAEITAAWLGFVSIIFGVIATITVAVFAERCKQRTKSLLVTMTCGEIVCFVVLVCVQQRYINVSPGAMTSTLYAVCILTSTFVNGVIPLYYELAIECVYPVNEELAKAFLCVVNNLIGMLFFFAILEPYLAQNTEWMAWLCLLSSITSLPLLLMLRKQCFRLDVDNSANGVLI